MELFAALKFGNWSVISYCTLWWMQFLIHAGIKVKTFSKPGLDDYLKHIYWLCNINSGREMKDYKWYQLPIQISSFTVKFYEKHHTFKTFEGHTLGFHICQTNKMITNWMLSLLITDIFTRDVIKLHGFQICDIGMSLVHLPPVVNFVGIYHLNM